MFWHYVYVLTNADISHLCHSTLPAIYIVIGTIGVTGLEMEFSKQGAEAKLYCTEFLGKKCVVKERFKKLYRHPELEASLTSQRMKNEVRALIKCRQCGKWLLYPMHASANQACAFSDDYEFLSALHLASTNLCFRVWTFFAAHHHSFTDLQLESSQYVV